MNNVNRTIPLLIILLFVGCNSIRNNIVPKEIYIPKEARIISEENITYYIDPANGNDKNIGTNKDEPWKTFRKINHLILTKGNNVEILSAGKFRESLFLIGEGTKESPIIVSFAPGRYDFFPQNAFKRKFHISNTNDAPDSLKSIALYFLDSKNININAVDADIVFRGKVIEACLNNCKNINIDGFNFDYQRPTVSEFKVTEVNNHFVDVEIHKDSKYKIIDSTLIWIGEGWQHKAENLWQIFNPKTQNLKRHNFPIDKFRFSEISKNRVQIFFDENPGFVKGLTYQNRNTFRDYAAVFMQGCKNIKWENAQIYFMHGMGFVSQLCENISYDSFYVGPRKGSERTCAAWADIFHFSSCKGNIEITNSHLSSANDDAINIHGTYLRIVKVISKQKLKVQFLHQQTYGFNIFSAGDSIEFIRAKSLIPFSKNKVAKSVLLNDKEIELTLEHDVPNNIQPNDVIENITLTPDIKISNTKITYIPTRGILVTTRGKVIIEDNEIVKTNMSGILIANDANSWFESGCVKNVIIRNNKFFECGEPVINIHPENSEITEQYLVHKNIQITGNHFTLKKNITLSAKSTKNIEFTNNVIKVNKDLKINNLLNLKACSKVEVKNNYVLNSKSKNVSTKK